MSKQINRRDFLKMVSLTAGSFLLSDLLPNPSNVQAQGATGLPNIIIFVFDAMTARNLSLYGYPRKTTPNFEKFAEKATVYHAHHSGGNFTTPGTASLLTGMYPWTHRALNDAGLVLRSLAERNIFNLMGGQYNRVAFSQNMWPNYLFGQFASGINSVLSPGDFSAVEQLVGARFPKHRDETYRAYEDFLFQEGAPPASLVFGLLSRLKVYRDAILAESNDYPRGLPYASNYPIFFRLHDIIDGLISTIQKLSSPHFGYFHVFSPHEPYRPTKDFDGKFNDKYKPVRKPNHPLVGHVTYSELNSRRMHYDDYVANVDAEFGRMIETLQNTGALENTYIVVTSDHGEGFERGYFGHSSPLLFEPLINVPLMIAAPGQKERQDVYSTTSCLDVLPTLLSIAGRPIPDWCEGTLLPGFGGKPDPQRSIFSMDAKSNLAYAPFTIASVSMRKDNYKLTYYKGYTSEDFFEMYDIEADPEEMNNFYASAPSVAKTMKEELLHRLDLANAPFEKN